VDGAAGVADVSVDALWRALNYLCAAQLYLRSDVLLERELAAEDIKAAPSGHWGVCPPVNLLLAALAPIAAAAPAGTRLVTLHGAGHAGPSALAYTYLTGALGAGWPHLRRGRAGLERLVRDFPHHGGVGGEITALLPATVYMGGQLGPVLAVAQGTVLDRPKTLAVALIGDGECETGVTAAAWLGVRALRGSGQHGHVLPVVLANGLRMGGPSVLASLGRDGQEAYFGGLGYRPVFCDGSDIAAVRDVLAAALRDARPPGELGGTVLVLTLPKGATGPGAVGTTPILHTPRVHKTPLRDPARMPEELATLRAWLASYRPSELLTADGKPTPLVAAALPAATCAGASPHLSPPEPNAVATARCARGVAIGTALGHVLERAAAAGGLRVFSPDELASNRVVFAGYRTPPWVTEVLSEELGHCWLQGHVEAGGRGVFISYEAFAGINASLADQYLKHLALTRAAGRPAAPSLNYVLTSLGWNNTYSHQNPGFATGILSREDPAVRVLLPPDGPRAAAALEAMLASRGRLNVLVTSKHPMPEHPLSTLVEELSHGVAVWPHLSDDRKPNLVLAAAGDIAARQLAAALPAIRARINVSVRFVCIADLSVLGDPTVLPHALSTPAFEARFGAEAPVLLATIGAPAAVRALLATRRGQADRFTVLGYRDPAAHLSGDALLVHCGLDSASLTDAAARLVAARTV
jgi:xylulose-5-phosphate/fructose-6-phosphate phosphoketolase